MAQINDVATVNGKRIWAYGFINSKGEEVIPLSLYQAMDYTKGVTFIQEEEDGKWFMIDKQGRKLSSVGYDAVDYSPYDNRWTVCNKNEDGITMKCGWVDLKGMLVIPLNYLRSAFTEGLCSTTPYGNELYGYIDTMGNEVIPFKSVQAGTSGFYNGLARTMINGKTAVIDKKGTVIVKPMFGTLPDLDDKYLIVGIGTGYGPFKYTDYEGKTVLAGPYITARAFHHELAEVSIKDKSGNEKAGIIDRSGKFVFPAEYNQISVDLEDYGCVYGLKDGTWYAYNTDGSVFPKVAYKYLGSKKDGELIPYCDPSTSLWGYLNMKGEKVIDAVYKSASGFSEEGLALVTLPEGYVATGKTPLPNQLTDAHRQVGPSKTVLVKYSDGWFYPATISTDGKGINWLDGTASVYQKEEIKEYNWLVGTSVNCNWKNKGTYYDGKIGEVKEGKLFIKYNDGDNEWVTTGQCRCK
jgi:hypothetical protein